MSRLKLSKESWTSQRVFILAAVGSAVGLGNLWKFPYITGENGGGAFVLVYLACIVLVGLPVMLSEFAIGRSGQANPVQAMSRVAKDSGASPWWKWLGINGVLAGVFILSFYSVIAGWALAYFFDSLQGAFVGIKPAQVEAHFNQLLASPLDLVIWHSIISIIVIAVVAKGVKNGIEKAINVLMPGLFLILLVLLGYATTSGGFAQSFNFLFNPDFTKLTWQAVLVAMGHAFFTLSLGMGVMMVYGSYLKQEYSLVKAGAWIAFADTLIALLAGLIIFSIVFANQLEPGSGPGLLFQTLPLAFAEMTGGWFFGTLFFALVVVAALSSAISIIEPVVSWLQQTRSITRAKATIIMGALIWFLGLGTVFSFNIWSEVHWFGDKTFFASLDFLTANIMLPLGGLFIAIFVGWRMQEHFRQKELAMPPTLAKVFMLALRWVSVVAIMVVFATNLATDNAVYWFVLLSLLIYLIYIASLQRRLRS